MLKLVSEGIWDLVSVMAANAKRRRVAISYVTEPKLLPLSRGDILVVDASDNSIAAGRTDAHALEDYLRSGVQLVSVSNLHAKVLLLDACAIIGSANVSKMSARHYVEAAVISDRPELRAQAEALLTELVRQGEEIDEAFIERIKAIPVAGRNEPSVGAGSGKISVRVSDPSYWLVSTREDARYSGDLGIVEKQMDEIQDEVNGKVDWFWWSGNGTFPSTAKVGDVVIQSTRPKAKMTSARGVRVYAHAVIERIFQEPGRRTKVFYCTWPQNCEDTALTWAQFSALARRAGVDRKITWRSNIKLKDRESAALDDLWPT